MPTLNETWVSAVVYMFGSVYDAERPHLEDDPNWPQAPGTITAKAATGVVVEIHTPKTTHQYVETNRHCIELGLAVPSLTLHDGSTKILDRVSDDWLCNVSATDLAVLPLTGLSEDVAGIPLSDDTCCNEYEYCVGDEVAMIGRFYPTSGGPFNAPVARFGNIARWPAQDVQLPWFPGDSVAKAVLVEMRSHSGYSGSPVFAFKGINDRINNALDDFRRDLSSEIYFHSNIDVDNRGVRFLGLDCGHLEGNMAVVIPWFELEAILKSELLHGKREERERVMPPAAIPD